MYEAVESCMKTQGFDYSPPAPTSAPLVGAGGDGADFASLEWAETWGFGVSTQLLPADVVGPNLKGFDEAADVLEVPQESLEGLPQEEVQAFFEALEGPEGCLAEGERLAFSVEPEPFEIEFRDELAELQERADAHPDVVGHAEGVQQCLAGRGYDYGSGYEAAIEFERRADALLGQLAYDADGSLDGPSGALLAELQADEIALASEVYDCDGWVHHYEEVYGQVLLGLEAEFVQRNAERLEEFRQDR